VPSYFCNYALSKIRHHYKDIKFIFYPINENLNFDINELIKINAKHAIDIFIKVNYFGKESSNSELTNFLHKNKSWLINDCTHCINPESNLEKYSDFSIYSPHKFYSIPSGAICKINFTGINKEFLKKNILNINVLKKEFINELNLNTFKINFFDLYSNLLWLIKRLIHLFYRSARIKNFEDESLQNYFDIDNKPFLGFFTKKLMINTIAFDSKVVVERKKTYYLWKLITKRILNNKFQYSYFLEDLQKPYNLILKADEKNTKNIYKSLKNNLIPVSTWPDLPPEIKSDFLHEKTFHLRNNLIFINLHPQTKKQLNFLNKYNNVIKKNNFKIIKILSDDDWEAYLKQVNYSYITSIKNYYKSFNLFKFEKFIINDENQNIGIFQICYVDIGKFIFIRLNLGPCFFPNVTEYLKKEALNHILTNLYSNKLKFFHISPNLNFNEENIIFNRKNNISDYSGVGWNSITIDLKNELKILKDELKNSLRRDIVKKNIDKKFTIKSIISTEQFSIFKENYNKEKKRKKFKGVSEKILKDLFLNKELIILNAYIGSKIISSVCVALHGNIATYLIGLNLDKSVSANDLLLWKMIILLKKNNFYKFDLGGIDFVNNRNVSIFKSNFGGKKYQLIGSKFLII
tara:strand:- start:892 stop:2790 length:1899 start_codon:yes stop_codon:yes gene_type:complete